MSDNIYLDSWCDKKYIPQSLDGIVNHEDATPDIPFPPNQINRVLVAGCTAVVSIPAEAYLVKWEINNLIILLIWEIAEKLL